MSSPPAREEEGGVHLGHIASPPRRHEQHSTNNPTYHPSEHPQVVREYKAKWDAEQETQSPEGTHQSGIFVAEGHGPGANPSSTMKRSNRMIYGGGGDVQEQGQRQAAEEEGQQGAAAER